MLKVKSPEDASIIIQKLPCDIGIHRNPRKGTLDAPEKILEDHDFEEDVLIYEAFPDEFDLEQTHSRFRENTEELIQYGKPLISIGGDHSVSFPVICALKERFPDLKLVWLDSHLDLKEKVDEHVSHDVVVRELLDHGFSEEEIIFVGITRVDEDEEEFLENGDLEVYRESGVGEFIREFSSNEQPVYLSVDIDVLKKELAPGTGYPNGELNLEEVQRIIEEINPDFADLVEVAPSLDNNNRTISNGKRILDSLIRNSS